MVFERCSCSCSYLWWRSWSYKDQICCCCCCSCVGWGRGWIELSIVVSILRHKFPFGARSVVTPWLDFTFLWDQMRTGQWDHLSLWGDFFLLIPLLPYLVHVAKIFELSIFLFSVKFTVLYKRYYTTPKYQNMNNIFLFSIEFFPTYVYNIASCKNKWQRNYFCTNVIFYYTKLARKKTRNYSFPSIGYKGHQYMGKGRRRCEYRPCEVQLVTTWFACEIHM